VERKKAGAYIETLQGKTGEERERTYGPALAPFSIQNVLRWRNVAKLKSEIASTENHPEMKGMDQVARPRGYRDLYILARPTEGKRGIISLSLELMFWTRSKLLSRHLIGRGAQRGGGMR